MTWEALVDGEKQGASLLRLLCRFQYTQTHMHEHQHRHMYLWAMELNKEVSEMRMVFKVKLKELTEEA